MGRGLVELQLDFNCPPSERSPPGYKLPSQLEWEEGEFGPLLFQKGAQKAIRLGQRDMIVQPWIKGGSARNWMIPQGWGKDQVHQGGMVARGLR